MLNNLSLFSKTLKKKKGFFLLGIFIVVLLLVLLIKAVVSSPFFIELIFKRNIELKKVDQRVNVLLLGIGGGSHDGPLLTDTIIYASIDPEKEKATLVSIPRDLWIPELSSKVNTAYAYGEAQKKGGGIILAKAVVEKIINQPIDYVIRIDFRGFVGAIDAVSGLDIDVEASFEDLQYPVSGKETDTCGFTGEEFEKRATASAILDAFPCRFEHIEFEKGLQHMDGVTALKFVRSRNAKGDEGTDFARAKRQEKVIEAFKKKVFSLGTLANPARVIDLYNVVKDSIDTNIKEEEYDDFVRLAQKMQNAVINNVVFYYTSPFEEEQGIVINPPVADEYKGQWVIIPRAGNGSFSEIQSYVACEIEGGDCNFK